ncbi:hypothetical protein ACQYWY_06985 [Comamonas sediminis]|uniref:hypothetical protein n=1 Tax=Comamonas sediminis TaxID=1783360 RepID=UPI003D273771
MAKIQVISRPVFLAPTKGRSYLTAKAAADNEAKALLSNKYPPDRCEYEDGQLIYPGWHWSTDERMQKTHERLSRLLLRQFRNAQRITKKTPTEDL